MERYDNIEYSFEQPSNSTATTDSEGYITSQQHAPTQEPPADEPPEELSEWTPKRHRDPDVPREIVLVMQLAVCILAAAAAFAIKNIGGELYDKAKTLYCENMNNSIIIEMDNQQNFNYVRDLLNNAKQ